MKIIRKMGILLLVALTLVVLCSSALAAGQLWIVEWPDGTKKEFATKAEAETAMNAADAAVEVRDYKTDQNGQIILPVQYAAYAKSLGQLIPFEQWHVVETVPSGYEAVGSTTTRFTQGDTVTIVNKKRTVETYPFTFTKEWHGGVDENTVFTLYQGEKLVKTFTMKDFQGNRIKVKKTVDGETWTMTIYLRQPVTGCYVIENVPKGYSARYENGSSKETSKCLNGGKIVNVKIPKTGDSAPLMLWIAFTGVAATALIITARKKRENM